MPKDTCLSIMSAFSAIFFFFFHKWETVAPNEFFLLIPHSKIKVMMIVITTPLSQRMNCLRIQIGLGY